jgi:hypothetical protein
MKSPPRKLALRKETLQTLARIHLSRADLEHVVGGYQSAPVDRCPGTALVNSFTCPK